ncbi:MAG: MotA/TolQ/ExbB proton channel family protein [Fibrobacteres bacterium]|nr:MotA/TolQ/ExbB proton channel family protein [Fibrobacterota bacterium]
MFSVALRTIRYPFRKSLGIAALLAASMAFGKEDPQAIQRQALADLQKELSSLENLKAEKLDALEKKEAERWDARYRAAARAKEDDERARSLEEKYGRLASDLTRTEEDLVKARSEAKDKVDEAAAVRAGWDGFNASLKRAIDGAAENLSLDVPVALEDRTLRLSKASEFMAAKGGANTQDALAAFLDASLLRVDQTLKQSLEDRQAVFGGGRPASAWRLQLGTVFVGELEKGSEGGNGRPGESQILLRTGNLQGKTFVWRNDLAGEYNRMLSTAISGAAQGKTVLALPLDVLQFKSLGSGFVKGEELSWQSRFAAWFKAGGVTLYPLFAVGILSLFMILERLVYFARKNTNARSFTARFLSLAEARRWREAKEMCSRSGSALARTLGALADKAEQSRDAAEKAVREALLREVPALEKRLPLIAAMGAAAPLLGLLGTVSGLVNLFKVLNQLGANDPKVLAGGISEALINTETGLAIAIPVLLIHGFLNERMDGINAAISSSAMEVLNKVWPKG